METIEATYRVTTPMFLGGAEQQAELRLPSFKGALRFWWRASVWPTVAAHGESLSNLYRREAEIFGSSEERIGQSKVGLRLRVNSGQPHVLPKKQPVEGWQHRRGARRPVSRLWRYGSVCQQQEAYSRGPTHAVLPASAVFLQYQHAFPQESEQRAARGSSTRP